MASRPLDPKLEIKLTSLLETLIDQRAARVLVAPYDNAPGYWFGGGNMARGPGGTLWLVGRYRNAGDSTTGLEAGARGLELALFASEDGGDSFAKTKSWTKAELSCGGAKVLSIEGSALHFTEGGDCELYLSSEKEAAYPEDVAQFQKPGTGIWSIDVITSSAEEDLDAGAIRPVLSHPADPCYLHLKDPVVFDGARGATILVFCSHPFLWSSSNSGYAARPRGEAAFDVVSWEMVSRGPAWDVAGTRVTCRMPVPRVGAFRDRPPVSVYFYDGLECVRQLDAHSRAVARPRGYSCEELGGACYGADDSFPSMTRLSRQLPLFVSPYGTGCSRYVDVLVDEDGLLATWQQGREDGSQPLVGNRLPMADVARLLS